MPQWADTAAINELYAKAKAMTERTGVAHSVDHIIPLQGELVSGLHVHYNLRVITKVENSRKGNRFDG